MAVDAPARLSETPDYAAEYATGGLGWNGLDAQSELSVDTLEQVLSDQGRFDSTRKFIAKDRIEADICGNTNFRKGTYVIDRCIERRPGIYIEIGLNAGLLRRSRTDRVASHNGAGGIQAGHDGGKIGRRERCR